MGEYDDSEFHFSRRCFFVCAFSAWENAFFQFPIDHFFLDSLAFHRDPFNRPEHVSVKINLKKQKIHSKSVLKCGMGQG